MLMMMMMMMMMMMIGKSLKSFKLVLWYLSMLFNHMASQLRRLQHAGGPADLHTLGWIQLQDEEVSLIRSQNYVYISIYIFYIYIYVYIYTYIHIYLHVLNKCIIYKCIYLQYIHVFTSHLNVSTPCIIFFLQCFFSTQWFLLIDSMVSETHENHEVEVAMAPNHLHQNRCVEYPQLLTSPNLPSLASLKMLQLP